MIFIGYAKNHAGDCYHMYNPTTGCMAKTRDTMWLHHMYYGKPEASNKVEVYPQVTFPFEHEDVEAREGVTLNTSEPMIKSKAEENELNTVHMRSDRVVKPLVL